MPKKKKNYLPESEEHRNLRLLIESLTHSGSKNLNKEELNKVFEKCGDRAALNETYKIVLLDLEKKHSEIRYSATQLCHELFLKFQEFRELVISEIHLFFKLTMGFQSKEPLPPPISTAKEMKKLALQYFFDWHTKFGHDYFKLKQALTYLDEIEHVDFRTFEIIDPKTRKERDEREQISKKIMEVKLNKTNEEMGELSHEIRSTLTSLNSCFELLLPSLYDCNEKNEKETNFQEDMRLYGIVNPKHSVTIEIELSDKIPIKVDDENSSIVDAAKDAYTLINNRFLPKVRAWREIIIKGNGGKDWLKKANLLKDELEAATRKYKKLHFMKENPHEGTEEDDEVTSDSDLEVVEEPKQKQVTFVDNSFFLTPSVKNREEKEKKITTSKGDTTPEEKPGPSGIQLNERKKKLLEIAPKVPFDIDLYHWEDEKLSTPTIIATNTEGARFWGGGCEDLIELPIPDGVSSLRTRVIEFSGHWQPVNHTCKAPLASGKLCPRQDRFRCPFHGLIVERDDKGNILNEEDIKRVAKSKSKPDVPDWQDPKLLSEIKAKTGIDLKMPEKGKRKKKKKHPGLTDLKEVKNTPTNRISKKIFNKKALRRVAATLDKIDNKKHKDKFGDQFNYVHGT